MEFPTLIAKMQQRQAVGIFGGLNQAAIISANEFADMTNISSEMYPGLMTRKTRGTVLKTLTKPHGLFWKNALFYIDGTKGYYNGKEVMTVKDSEKMICGMGAFIVVWPDKLVLNTTNNSVTSIEATYNQTAALTVAPVSTGSTFVKISGNNIGKSFNKGDAVQISGFTKNTDLLNVSKIIQEKTDSSITIIAAGVSSFTQASGVKLVRTAPDMDFICELNNRLWGCSSKNHEIYASKLGDPTNWNCFEGLSTDSYALTVGSDGDFTGCIPHNGYVVFFKEDCIHTIYGSKPSNYTMDTVQGRGPAKGCEKSLSRVGESVLYAGREDILIYEGSIPESISDKLSMQWQAARANQYDGKYFLNLQEPGGEWSLLVYDLRRSLQNEQQLWYREDNTEMKYSCFAEGKLYIIDGKNRLREIYGKEQETGIEWELVSGDLEEGMLQKKKLHKLLFNVELEQKAHFDVYLSYDNSPMWLRAASITADQRGTYGVPVKLKRCSRYRYKLKGHGRMRLFGMVRVIGGGTDR